MKCRFATIRQTLMTKAMTREKLIKFGRARIIVRRLGPTCTAASVTPNTETLTVSESQTDSILGNLRTAIETGIDDSPQLSTSNSVDESAKYQCERGQHVGWYDSANIASTKEAIENDVAQVESIDDDIASLFCTDGNSLSDSKMGAANAGKKLQTTASLKPSWWTLQTC